MLWLAAPLTGRIVQPFTGHWSDRTRDKRRVVFEAPPEGWRCVRRRFANCSTGTTDSLAPAQASADGRESRRMSTIDGVWGLNRHHHVSTLDPVPGVSPGARCRQRDGYGRPAGHTETLALAVFPGRFVSLLSGSIPASGVPAIQVMGAGLVGGRIANSSGVCFGFGRSSRPA